MQTKRLSGVWRFFVRGKLNSRAEGGWSICETRRDWRTILARLKIEEGWRAEQSCGCVFQGDHKKIAITKRKRS
jgi:hypothetical protein